MLYLPQTPPHPESEKKPPVIAAPKKTLLATQRCRFSLRPTNILAFNTNLTIVEK